MKQFIVCLGIFLLAAPATAVTYKWLDEKGVVSYADDLGKVPKRFRDRVIVVDEQVPPVEILESTEEGKGAKKGKGTTETDKAEGGAAKGERARVMYGDREEDAWKKEFAKLKRDIAATEEFMAETKNRLNDTGKMSRGEYLSLQNTIKDSEARLAGLRKKLDALVEAANKAKVPNDLR